MVENVPTYILYRLDSQNNLGYEWIFFSFVPDRAPVRQKMMYSSTKATFKQALGVGRFYIDIHGTVKNDLTLSSYQKYIDHKHAEAPLTQAELDRKEEEEHGIFVGGSGTGSITNSGISFPIEENVASGIKDFVAGKCNYVQVIVDVQSERIKLGKTATININELAAQVPNNEPRFHFYNYTHNHEGSTLTTSLFIYSCPTGSDGTVSAPIKQRTLYSSSKSHIALTAESLGFANYTKLEINSGMEVSETNINLTLHPPVVEEKKAFSKPSKPGRGPPRLNRRT